LWRHAGVPGIDAEHPARDEKPVVAIGNQVDRHGGDDHPQGVDGFAATERDDAERARTEQCERGPAELGQDAVHIFSFRRTP